LALMVPELVPKVLGTPLWLVMVRLLLTGPDRVPAAVPVRAGAMAVAWVPLLVAV